MLFKASWEFDSNLIPSRPILLSPCSAQLIGQLLMVLCQLQPRPQITRTATLRRVSNAKLPIHHNCSPKETVLIGTKASHEKPNASGLTPDQTRALPERSVDPDGPEARIIRSLRELYSCKAQNVRLGRPHLRSVPESKVSQRSYEIYTHDAVFHDPIGIARGIDSIYAQFDALPRVRTTRDCPILRTLLES